MEMQTFDTMEQAAATFPRFMDKVTVPTPYQCAVMLSAGQRKLRSGYNVRPGTFAEQWKHRAQ